VKVKHNYNTVIVHLDDVTAAILHQNTHHTPVYWWMWHSVNVVWKFGFVFKVLRKCVMVLRNVFFF